MRRAIREVRPDLPTGTTLAFHEAIDNNHFDPIEAFEDSDYFAYTYYPHDQGFRYDGDTGDFGRVLEQMIEVSGETPFHIVENGWATAASLGSSEANQADYLDNTFQSLTEHRDSFARHIWYNLHDGRPQNCTTAALSFFPPDFDPSSVGKCWNYFED
jgi:hypothetical protein